MFGSDFLEVAIGLSFTYLILSLVVTAFVEAVSASLNIRANVLENGIKRLLSADQDTQQHWQALYNHPLVQALSQKTDKKPPYIRPETFSRALLDIVAPITTISQSADDRFSEIRTKIAGLQSTNPPLYKTLMIFLEEAEKSHHKLDQVHKNIQAWFNETMERLGGWYKQYLLRYTFGAALVLTIVFNVDSGLLLNAFANDVAVRDAVVAQAENLTDDPSAVAQKSPDELRQELEGLQVIGWPSKPFDQAADRRAMPDELGSIVTRIMGWLVTTLAVSLGAPFWFDLLNKLVNLRATGKRIPTTFDDENDKKQDEKKPKQ